MRPCCAHTLTEKRARSLSAGRRAAAHEVHLAALEPTVESALKLVSTAARHPRARYGDALVKLKGVVSDVRKVMYEGPPPPKRKK